MSMSWPLSFSSTSFLWFFFRPSKIFIYFNSIISLYVSIFVRWQNTLEVDNLNPSFLSRRYGSPNKSESYAFLHIVRCNDKQLGPICIPCRGPLLCTLCSLFFGFLIISSKRKRQCQDSNRQPPDLICDELDHKTTVSCFCNIYL